MNDELIADATSASLDASEAKNRVDAFLKAYGELVQEHKIDFASYPVFVPDSQGGFKVIVQSTPVDITNQPVKSPFIPNN